MDVRAKEASAYDPTNVQDTVCEGLIAITKIGRDALRFTIYATRDYGDEMIERRVVAQLVWTREDLQMAIYQAQIVLDGGPFLDMTAPSPDTVPN
jgi:hypothetical protein